VTSATHHRAVDEPRQAILAAARQLLASEGVEALTVRRIAAAAGGSTMNVYSRFGGKDGVVDALFVEGFEELGAALRRVRTTADPIADLERLARAYRTFALAHPAHYMLIFDTPPPPEGKSDRAITAAIGALGQLAARIRRAIDHGDLRDGDEWELATIFWSACHGPVSLELKNVGPPNVDWADIHARLHAAMIDGLRRR
jgi:AcrR family transcriptional regulator